MSENICPFDGIEMIYDEDRDYYFCPICPYAKMYSGKMTKDDEELRYIGQLLLVSYKSILKLFI